MFFAILTLITAIGISVVAAWYSIVGLMAIFAAAAIPIAIMGGVLEVGKLVTASWLYRNWKTSNKVLRTYLTTAVVVLMFVTSMGIFGYLSKAHIDQTLVGGDNTLEIQSLDQQIEQEQRVIDDAKKVIAQLDSAVETLTKFSRISGPNGAIAVRQKQTMERESLNNIISESSKKIKSIRDSKKELTKQQLKVEAEVGPIKYIAALFVKDPKNILEDAVRWVIITIIFVFDPLAIGLLIAANSSLNKPKPIQKAVNVSDDWKEVDVETEDEFTFKIPDEIVQSPENTVEIAENYMYGDPEAPVVRTDQNPLMSEWKEPLYNDRDFKKREEQNEDAFKQSGAYGPTKL